MRKPGHAAVRPSIFPTADQPSEQRRESGTLFNLKPTPRTGDAMDVVEVDADLCDTCGCRAFVYVELPKGGSLAYCGHHGAEYLPRLNEIGATVIDLRHAVHP